MRALITGASSGIGREIAILLSEIGVETILVARREERLKDLQSRLKTKSEIIVTDLSLPGNAEKLFNDAGNVDILVNNAGFGVFGEFDIVPLEKEQQLISLNVTALHVLTKLYLKEFKKKDSGYILNVGSIASFLNGPLFSSYYASKSYVMRLSSAIYYELKKEKSNVKISCLCPGPVVTEFNEVAGVSFGPLGMRADKVAKIALSGMFKGKRLVLPGLLIKTCRILAKICPDSVTSRVVMMIQNARVLKE